MNKRIALSLKNNYSSDPYLVDRVLISAYVFLNKVKIKRNRFLQDYLIPSVGNGKENEALSDFLKMLNKHSIALNMEELIEMFEYVISPEDKVITGAIYTPKQIRECIINKVLAGQNISIVKVADIACGCGGFLYDIAKQIKVRSQNSYFEIFRNQLFGLDIQKYSVVRTKLILVLLAVSDNEDIDEFEFNVFTGNALNFQWNLVIDDYVGFDAIVGNPPYVCSRNISDDSRKLLPLWSVSDSGHPDLYIPFFQIALVNLKQNGKLGYITMNSFFKSVNGRAIRQYFNDNQFNFEIIDFSSFQVFKSKSTYTCICFITKSRSENLKYRICRDLDNLNSQEPFFETDYSTLNPYKGWHLNSQQSNIKKIESMGVPFYNKFKTRNGIATLKNHVYIFLPIKQNKTYYYLSVDGQLFPIEKKICREIINSNLLTTVKSVAKIKEQIIFPYEFVEDKAVAISEEKMKKKFPKTLAYLLTKKQVLSKRDKGKGRFYQPWFIYGRNQSLEKIKHKLFFPHIASETPNYLINSDENLLFYNGLAALAESKTDLIVLRKILMSRIFWYYIIHTSRPYGSEYYSLSRNHLKNFGIPDFTKEEISMIQRERSMEVLNNFFEKKYAIKIS